MQFEYKKGGLSKKTIEEKINFKVNEFIKELKNISKSEDENFETEIKNSIIISGGCIASMLLGEPVNDYDIYFNDREVAKKVAKIYVNKLSTKNDRVSDIDIRDTKFGIEIFIKSAGLATDEGQNLDEYQYFEALSPQELAKYLKKVDSEKVKDYHPQYISSNAITLGGDIQLILRFIGDVEEVHRSFDFTHAKNYWSAETGLILNINSLESIMSKRLKYSGSMFPICSLIRMRKFLKRNWTISAGEILKISMDISKLDLTDAEVLRDQLTGVDQAFFHEVIQMLKEGEKEGKTIDQTYIVEVIERVFG